MCRTSPSQPASETTRLLPPLSTKRRTRFARANATASSTSLWLRARTRNFALPPTPSVVSGASGTFSCNSIVCNGLRNHYIRKPACNFRSLLGRDAKLFSR